MALKLAGEQTGFQQKVERILYLPGLQDSGDLEAATKSITATTKQGSPDYTASLTTSAPPDSRMVVTQMAVRLQVTIDSMTAGHLYGELHVNGVNRKSFDFTSTGAKLTAIDLASGQFNVGSANTIQVFLWVDSGNAMVSVCQLWQAVGQQRTNGPFTCMEIRHSGFVQVAFWADRIGTGTITVRGGIRGAESLNTAVAFHTTQNESLNIPNLILCYDTLALGTHATVDTDIVYLRDITAVLHTLG